MSKCDATRIPRNLNAVPTFLWDGGGGYNRPPVTSVAPRILAVDDEPSIRELIERFLASDGYQVTTVATGREFLEAVQRLSPDLCILDIDLPDANGVALLTQVRESSDVPAIMLTGADSAATAVLALRAGASDYLTKPLTDWRKLSVAIRNALTISRQSRELHDLRVAVRDTYGLESIIGSSVRMTESKAMARKLAGSDATVLIRGESGVGKELFARAIHTGGGRAKGPFIDVNCAALTESLLESEIFGHEKGAFTGAVGRRVGKFEQADGGTIFLDEIGDMPMATQAKLLRVLQERSFQRVGGSEKVTVNVRVLSATNQPLEKAVAENTFRQDLYYRINTVTLEVAPLRDRKEDIFALASHFIALAARRDGRAVPALSAEARECLMRHSWPGNIRELENAMTRAVILCDGAQLEPRMLPPQVLGASRGAAVGIPAADAVPSGGLLESVEALERRMITDAMEKHDWIKARAARALGLTERILAYKIATYGIARNAP